MNKKYILYFYLLINIFGCSSIDVNVKSSIDIPKNFNNDIVSNNDNNLLNWWEQYKDNNLNKLIRKAIKNNLSIKSAQENYNASIALYNVAKADLTPMIGMNVQYNKNLNNTIRNDDLNYINYIEDNPFKNDKGHFYHTDISASWEPDIFGKKRSEKDYAFYNSLSLEEQIYASKLLITSKITQNYLSAASIKKRISILENAISVIEKQIIYSKERFNSGQTNQTSIYKAKANLARIKAKKQTLLAEFKSIESSIAVLIVEPLQKFSLQVDENILNKKIPVPNGVYPGDLLQRRPDLRALKNIVMSLMSKVASAKADLFPRFYINFLFQDGHISLQDITKATIKRNAFDIGIKLPIFTFGRIKNLILSTNARLKSAVYNYDNALLEAINETDNLYYTNKCFDISTNELNNSLTSYKKITNDKTSLFENGFTNYDDVLNSKLDSLNIEDEYIKNKLYLNLTTIALYQSLGGGW